MAAPGWMFVLMDVNGSVLGELLGAYNKQVVLPLKSTPTCSLTVKTSHTLAPYLLDRANEYMIKAYRNGVLKFCGPLVSSQEVGGQGTADGIQINASGPFWRLNYRLAGISLGSPATVAAYVDGPASLATLAGNLINYANAEGSHTGIGLGFIGSTATGTVGPFYLQPIGDAITALSAAGFEWEIDPIEPTPIGGSVQQIGIFNTADLIGIVNDNVTFEYGTGEASIASYSNAIDRQGMMNIGYITQPTATDYSGTLSFEDTPSVTARGAYLGVVDNGGVEFDTLRTSILDANINARTFARQIISFTPRPDATFQPTVDYQVGDRIHCNIVKDGVFRLNAQVRIWGIQFDISPEGNETPTITTVPT